MRGRARRILLTAAALSLAALGLPATSHGIGLELREFTMTPVQRSLYNCGDVNQFPDVRVPCRNPNDPNDLTGLLTQAGGHPVMRINFAFCSAEPRNYHVHTTITPITNPAVAHNVTTANGGTYTITFGGQTTAPLAFNAGPAAIKAALEALPNVGAGKITLIEGGPLFGPTAAPLKFVKAANPNGSPPAVSVNAASVSGPDAPYSTPFAAPSVGGNTDLAAGCVSGVSATPGAAASSATGGTYTITVAASGGPETTTPIAYNASRTEIRDAIAALPSIGQGKIDVTGGPLFGPGAQRVNIKPIDIVGGLPTITIAPGSVTGPDSPYSASVSEPKAQTTTYAKDFNIHLPPGALGNPEAVVPCPYHLWVAFACPPESNLGVSKSQGVVQGGGGTVPVVTPLVRVETLGLEPARLGTGPVPANPVGPLPIAITLRSSGDYGIDSATINLPKVLGAFPAVVSRIDATLCDYAPCNSFSGTPAAGAKPFFVNPTSCGVHPASVDAVSWQDPDPAHKTTIQEGTRERVVIDNDKDRDTLLDTNVNPVLDEPYHTEQYLGPRYTTTGCENVPFDLGVSVKPDNTTANAPSGYTVSLDYPDYANDPIWQSQLKSAVVTLPSGVRLSPGGGVGLQECTAEQFGVSDYGDANTPPKTNDAPVHCPPQSAIGDVKVTSPVLPGDIDHPPLTGKAFFGPATASGRPTPDKPWKLFLLLEGQGLRVKLIGDVTLCSGPGAPTPDCQEDGQVRTSFPQNPQVPFSHFVLHTNDQTAEHNAPLMNPRDCGSYTINAHFVGWSGAVRDKSGTYSIDSGCGPEPFQPTIQDASGTPTQAGAHSTSHLLFSRPDGNQLIKRLKLSLPPGAAGSLATVPLCPAANARAGTCPDSSRVGTIRTTVGTGAGLLTTSGSVFIGEPVEAGDAASFIIVIPTKVGPIDLGQNVVVVNRVQLRPSDTGVDAVSDDIPTMLEGIPLPVRSIDITIDHDNFFLNPTGCDRRNFVATFTGDRGATASADFATQATGCDQEPFAPKLRLIAGQRGQTRTNQNVPLKAIVTQNDGEAAIAKARVVIPDLIRPNVPQLQKPGALCTGAQLDAHACPSSSQIGTANVRTPLLPFTLSGPVYISLREGAALPNLVVYLRGGGFEVRLNATNGFEGIKLLNEFTGVPDVPQSRFELDVKGGTNGILLAHSNLCTTRPLPLIDATFTAHSGKVVNTKPRIEVDGCGASAASAKRVKIVTKKTRLTKRGAARIKVRCLARSGKCAGKLSLRGAIRKGKKARKIGSKGFSIKAGKAKVVTVKLARKGVRAASRQNRLKVTASATVRGGKKASRKVTLRPRKK